jgi:hypothetical protein
METGVGMKNAWLHDQGLVSLKSLWVKRAPLSNRVARPRMFRGVGGGPSNPPASPIRPLPGGPGPNRLQPGP